MPETLPRSAPSTVACTPVLPAAVAAVCEPWLCQPRGERNSRRITLSGPTPFTKYRPPITLLLQVNQGASRPLSQTPLNRLAVVTSLQPFGTAAKLPFSSQSPESITPTMTSSPALAAPPNCCCQSPLGPVRPSMLGVVEVSSLRTSSLVTEITPGVAASVLACLPVSSAAKPVNVKL
jgi:hypothetical protein